MAVLGPWNIAASEPQGLVAGSNHLVSLWHGALVSALEDTRGLWESMRIRGWEVRLRSSLGPQSCSCPPDCRCSPLGAVSSQCRENSTCVCRPGFTGYKCDHCQDNFFLAEGDTGCRECPACYALVKEGVSCYAETPHLQVRFTPPGNTSSMLWTRSCLLIHRPQALRAH